MIKHSRQRDAVYNNLSLRKDHPTAEAIYFSLKPLLPALSLATVYRNLAMLEDEGKIMRIGSGGTARYDADMSEHQHLLCEKCGNVFDIMISLDGITQKAADFFDGKINSYSVLYKGFCSECLCHSAE